MNEKTYSIQPVAVLEAATELAFEFYEIYKETNSVIAWVMGTSEKERVLNLADGEEELVGELVCLKMIVDGTTESFTEEEWMQVYDDITITIGLISLVYQGKLKIVSRGVKDSEWDFEPVENTDINYIYDGKTTHISLSGD